MGVLDSVRVLELISIVPILILFIVPFWNIFSKAGFSGWLSLLMLVPAVNIILLFYLAFAEWPILKDLKK